MTRRRKKHRPDEIVAKLRDADAKHHAGKDLTAMLQALEVGDSTLERRRPGHCREAVVGGGMKCEGSQEAQAPLGVKLASPSRK
jgi:hypothetical protein